MRWGRLQPNVTYFCGGFLHRVAHASACRVGSQADACDSAALTFTTTRADKSVGSARTSACASVPGMGRISLDERSQPEPMTATVAKPQGVAAR